MQPTDGCGAGRFLRVASDEKGKCGVCKGKRLYTEFDGQLRAYGAPEIHGQASLTTAGLTRLIVIDKIIAVGLAAGTLTGALFEDERAFSGSAAG